MITITPSSASVVTDDTVRLSATVTDASGAPLPGVVVGWTSSDASVASVDAAGLVTGRRAGSATMTASAGGAERSATVTVTLPPPPPPPPPPPRIVLARDTVSFFRVLDVRRLPGPDSVAIRNGGGGVLAGLEAATVEWRGAEGWLELQVRPTTAPTKLRLALNGRALELPVGTYVAVVAVASRVAANSPVLMRVTYTVARR